MQHVSGPQGAAAAQRLQLFEEAVQLHGTAPPEKMATVSMGKTCENLEIPGNTWEKHGKT